MYIQREASQLRQQFWTICGQYLAPILNADGEKINWVNYKTQNRFIQIKMAAGDKSASISIEIHHFDANIQQQYFSQFLMQQNLFENIAGKDWQWLPNYENKEGENISIIKKEISHVSIFTKENWPELISFFKQSITTFDEFWQIAKYGFE